jgi:glycosyltransferase involved in cell wall biosynthesis
MNKLISVITPCFNEEDNVEALYERIKAVFVEFPQYSYEHIFIDNASTDRTAEKIKALAFKDNRVKLIVNIRNFGHVRSPVHAIQQAKGEAVICMASDLQDPPELIADFIAKWEEGYPVVAGVKPKSQETPLMFLVRRFYYSLMSRISEVPLLQNFTGFGLYDRSVIEVVRKLDDPYPYFRGLISELGFPVAQIPYVQPKRIRGITKNNFYTLYDIAMLGITSHSKIPLRMATFLGFCIGGLSFVVAFIYLIYKLLYWDSFQLGTAPLIIGFFFIASVQLFFIGILGEYIGAIHTQVLRRPLVIEKERVNFD